MRKREGQREKEKRDIKSERKRKNGKQRAHRELKRE